MARKNYLFLQRCVKVSGLENCFLGEVITINNGDATPCVVIKLNSNGTLGCMVIDAFGKKNHKVKSGMLVTRTLKPFIGKIWTS